jgi:DNA-binding response OmpR family regulator
VGSDAVNDARVKRFDIIIMDVRLPDMPSDQVITQIREFDLRVPIIVLSGASTKQEAAKACLAGATTVLAKPVEGGDLEKMLRRYLHVEEM